MTSDNIAQSVKPLRIEDHLNGILNIYRTPLKKLITQCVKQNKFTASEISKITKIDNATISRKLLIREEESLGL